MQKAWQITLKDLRITFGNRNLILIMFAAPLLLASIIGVTFGGVSGRSAPIEHIPVAVVNLDAGASLGLAAEGDTSINYGNILTDLLVTGTASTPGESDLTGSGGGVTIAGMDTAAFNCPTAPASSGSSAQDSSLDTLIDGTRFANVDLARAAVGRGEFAAAVIIPADFSANLQVSPSKTTIIPSTIEVYAFAQAPIAAQIVRSVVDQAGAQFAAGNVTLAALLSSLPSNPLQLAAVVTSPAFGEGIACAFTDVGSSISVERQTVGGDELIVNALVFVGAAQALFFALFTANGQAGSIIAERRDWTLQRMLTTPTPAVMILLGKIMAVFVIVFLQILFLFIGLTVIASLIAGEVTYIWGPNLIGTLLVLLAAALATSGIGSITAAVAKNEEQANTIGGVVAIFMAVFGGSFGFSLPGVLSQLSVITWGRDAFAKLAAGNNDILVNLLVLSAVGIGAFAVGFVLFRSKISDR